MDEEPTTSQYCRTKISPTKSARGGKVNNKFRKIVDEQAKRKVRRCVYSQNSSQRWTVTKLTPKKCSPYQKARKRWLNKSKVLQNCKKKRAKTISTTLEDGEVCSEDEDDCIVIEPTLEEITIDDNDADDFSIISGASTHYQSVMDSFRERVSSTPYCKQYAPTSLNITKPQNVSDNPVMGTGILPFFVDIGRGTESINSTDNFTDYIKSTTTLRENSTRPRRSVNFKETSVSEVIELDDTSSDNIDVTLKCNTGQLQDDSIIFISETNTNDFIPIVDDSLPPHKILKINPPTATTPANRMPPNSLFTRSETKKLNAYNENAYNPSSSVELKTGKRMVIIDGSNVAFKHGLDQEFSVKGLQIVIEYFEKMGHEVKAVIPQFRMNRTKSSNQEELLNLHKAGKIVQTPCKNLPGHTSTSYDDRFILQLAFATDAAIVSNDNYRDLLHENPAFKKIIENRVIGYTWCNDIFILPKDPYGKWGPSLDTILNRT